MLAGAPECPWAEPKDAPHIEKTVFGTVEYKSSFDPKWFNCVKKAGGTLELTWSVGAGGELAPLPPKKLTSYREAISVSYGDICSATGSRQVQATLKGTGGFERLDWSSSIVEMFCTACTWRSGDFSLALFTRALTPAGTWTLDIGFDEEWLTCAKKSGALEVHFFLGDSAADVRSAKQPSHVVKLDATKRTKKTFPSADLCKGKPKYVGYELTGTGEFQELASKLGRSAQESECGR